MTIAWMLTRMIFMRFLIILFGISAFVILLEVVTYSEEILKLRNNEVSALAHYAALLLPRTLSTFLGMSVLLVEQKLPIVRKVAEDFAILDKGRLVASGELSELTNELVARHLVV